MRTDPSQTATDGAAGPSLFDDLVAGLAAIDGGVTRSVAEVRIVVETGSVSRSFPMGTEQRLIVGRAADADVVVGAAQASRRHAELRMIDGLISCIDAGSANGTWVQRGGDRHDAATAVVVAAGDRIVTTGDIVLLAVVEVTTDGVPR